MMEDVMSISIIQRKRVHAENYYRNCKRCYIDSPRKEKSQIKLKESRK